MLFYENKLKHNQLAAIIDGLPIVRKEYKEWDAKMEGLSRQLTGELRRLEAQSEQEVGGRTREERAVNPAQLNFLMFFKIKKMESQNDKTDYSYLLKINLPLSQQKYKELHRAMEKGQLKWSDSPNSLKDAYMSFEAWQRGIDEGDWLDWH